MCFSGVAKKVISIDDANRIPEQLNQAWQTAVSGRPGPVVVVLYEDMLRDEVSVADIPPAEAYRRFPPAPAQDAILQVAEELRSAKKPLIISGDSGWSRRHQTLLTEFSEQHQVPVAAAFRRQDSFDNTHPNYIGELGLSIAPALREYLAQSDLLLVIGPRLGEMTTDGYELIAPPLGHTGQRLVHVHPSGEEPGSVFHADVAVHSDTAEFLGTMQGISPSPGDRQELIASLHARYNAWVEEPVSEGQEPRMDSICATIRNVLPAEAVVTVGAGSYTTWGQRFYRYRLSGTQLGSTNGTMGYSTPAAIAAKLLKPETPVVSFNGDGCFMMNGQEFATAVQYGLHVVFLVINNRRLGTIRVHQERHYPGRVVGTELHNPDFAKLAEAYGGRGFTVTRTGEFASAFKDALAARVPALIDIQVP